MLRSPCERYLKYLITRKDGLDNQRIRAIVEMSQLDYIGDFYVNFLRSECVPPTPFKPKNVGHVPSRRFLQEHGFEGFYRKDSVTTAAVAILDMPAAKEKIETLAVNRFPPKFISSALRRDGFSTTPEVIERYQSYFFDVENLNRLELKAIIMTRLIPGPTADEGMRRLNAHLADAAHSDPRILSLEMSVLPLAQMMQLLRMGYIPSNVDAARILKATQITAQSRACDAAAGGKTSDARDYSAVAKIVSDIIEQTGEAEVDLREGLGGFLMTTDDKKLPNIRDLGGSYTTDLQPLEDGRGSGE